MIGRPLYLAALPYPQQANAASQQAAKAEQQADIAFETVLGAAAYAPVLEMSRTVEATKYFFMIIPI